MLRGRITSFSARKSQSSLPPIFAFLSGNTVTEMFTYSPISTWQSFFTYAVFNFSQERNAYLHISRRDSGNVTSLTPLLQKALP